MRDQHVAVLGPADLAGVDVLHDEAEQVAVPKVDQSPNIAAIEILEKSATRYLSRS